MRTDGDIIYYEIVFKYKRKGQWTHAGDTSGFEKSRELYEMCAPLRASSDFWQKYGIEATADFDIAADIAKEMAKQYPQHTWGVNKVHMVQETKNVMSLTMDSKDWVDK